MYLTDAPSDLPTKIDAPGNENRLANGVGQVLETLIGGLRCPPASGMHGLAIDKRRTGKQQRDGMYHAITVLVFAKVQPGASTEEVVV